MNLDEQIMAFLNETETRPPASKLEPYAELIHGLRQRRWTYRQIATVLHERFGTRVAASSVHNFLKVRSKRKMDASTTPGEAAPFRAHESSGKVESAPHPRRRFRLDF